MLELGLTSPVDVGLALMVKQASWTPALLGALLGAFGLGSVLAPLVTPSRLRSPGRTRTSFAFGAVTFALFGAATYLEADWWIVAAVFAVGWASTWIAVVVIPALQGRCDPAYLGRFGAAVSFTFSSVTPVSMLAFAFLSAAVGLRWSFASFSLVAACAAASALVLPKRCDPADT